MLESALSAGLCAMGANVTSPGLMPTPAVARVTHEIGADAGVVISASHNPFPDNGIKFFGPDGYKLADSLEAELETLVSDAFSLPRPAGAGIGQVRRDPELRDLYARHIEETMRGIRLKGLKIVLDAANGAASELAPRVFSDLGADVVAIHASPNGCNINEGCGALHPQSMQQAVKKEKADLGIAFDGDADRVILADETGQIVDGDRVMAVCGLYLAERGELSGSTVVGTIMSNMGLEVALRDKGVRLIRTAVGDRCVSEEMRRGVYVLGGEKSGHIIFGSLTTTGDGILSALQVIQVMRQTKRSLSELASVMTEYPQVLLNIRVTDRRAWGKPPRLSEAHLLGERGFARSGPGECPGVGHGKALACYGRRPGPGAGFGFGAGYRHACAPNVGRGEMIISQTPLRISFAGGGTDFADFYERHGGAVISSAIDKYIYVIIKSRFDTKIRVGYTRTEMVDQVAQIEHDLVRECLRLTGINEGIEIATMADIPSEGSGLGSSSSVTVGLLHAMYAYKGELITAARLAEEACRIEIGILGKPIGKQDQYIAAFGGLRRFAFCKDGATDASALPMPEVGWLRLSESLMLFYTGLTRSADLILKEQKANISEQTSTLLSIKDQVAEVESCLLNHDMSQIGRILDAGWQLKKQLAGKISSDHIDELYERALTAGATGASVSGAPIGGKVAGAGGGGFLLLFCPPDRQGAVRAALSELKELPFHLENDGSKVIFNCRRS